MPSLARVMHCCRRMVEALLVTGFLGGFLVVLSGALFWIAHATGGPGDDEPADRLRGERS